MKNLPLFNTQKKMFDGFIAIILLIAFVLFLQSSNFSTLISTSVGIITTSIYIIITQRNRTKKYYFIIEKGAIRRKMLAMEEECKIELGDDISDITQDWKGIHFKSYEKQHSILTDGLTKKQKKIIVKSLKDYPSLLS